jgi:hypothetical protein
VRGCQIEAPEEDDTAEAVRPAVDFDLLGDVDEFVELAQYAKDKQREEAAEGERTSQHASNDGSYDADACEGALQ